MVEVWALPTDHSSDSYSSERRHRTGRCSESNRDIKPGFRARNNSASLERGNQVRMRTQAAWTQWAGINCSYSLPIEALEGIQKKLKDTATAIIRQ